MSTEAEISKSALVTVTDAVPVLLAAATSIWSTDQSDAVLTIVEPPASASTRARNSRAFATPLDSGPTSHTPVPLSYVPTDGASESYVSPAGRTSRTCTPVASTGPLFITVIVNSTRSLALGAGLSTPLVTATSSMRLSLNAVQ